LVSSPGQTGLVLVDSAVLSDLAGRAGSDLARGFLFREVNSRIFDLNVSFATRPEEIRLFCECGHEDCRAQVEVPLRVFREIRDDPERRVLHAGHDQSGQAEAPATAA
jgi:hypothetical protein